MYAQTNIQLYNQLVRARTSSDDLALIRRAYDLAVKLFAGLYRPNGKTFLDHVVGTASILHKVQGKPVLTAAGLLHSAYSHGDFGLLGRLSSAACHQRLIDSVGHQVEAYVHGYEKLPWSMGCARELLARIDVMTPFERELVLMRVVNELDDHLDAGTLYCYRAAAHQDRLDSRRDLLFALARKLDSAAVEREIDRVFAVCAGQPVQPALLPTRRRPRSYRMLPASCRRSVWLFAYEALRRVRRALH